MAKSPLAVSPDENLLEAPEIHGRRHCRHLDEATARIRQGRHFSEFQALWVDTSQARSQQEIPDLDIAPSGFERELGFAGPPSIDHATRPTSLNDAVDCALTVKHQHRLGGMIGSSRHHPYHSCMGDDRISRQDPVFAPTVHQHGPKEGADVETDHGRG